MIINAVKGKGFRGALEYNFKKDNTSHLLHTNFASSDARGMSAETAPVRALRPNLKNAVLHVSINLHPDDEMHDDDFIRLAHEYLEHMGFDLIQNQFGIWRHTDSAHPHIHIVANRINTVTGEVVSDSQDYKRQVEFSEDAEMRYGLIVADRTTYHDRRLRKSVVTKNEYEMRDRLDSPIPTPKLYIAQVLTEILETKPDLDTFVVALADYGIGVHTKKGADEEIKGISFEYEGQVYTGSGIGRGFTFPSLVKKGLRYDPVLEVSRRERDEAVKQSFLHYAADALEREGAFYVRGAGAGVSTSPTPLTQEDWKSALYFFDDFQYLPGPPPHTFASDRFVQVLDYGDRLIFSSTSDVVGAASRAVAAAKLKGWEGMTIEGSDAFKNAVFTAAREQGFEGAINGVFATKNNTPELNF
jgi:hypothetical protein